MENPEGLNEITAPYLNNIYPIIDDIIDKTNDVLINGIILGKATWLSRTIENWTRETIPYPHIAKIASSLIIAAPFVIASRSTPGFIFMGVCAGARVITILSNESSEENIYTLIHESCKPIVNGSGLAHIADGISDLAEYSVTNDILKIVTGATGIALGVFNLLNTKLIDDIASGVGELYNSQLKMYS